MNVAELLAEVEGWGGTVDLDQDKLVVDVPEAFPDAIVERLRVYKSEIVHHLTQRVHLENHQDCFVGNYDPKFVVCLRTIEQPTVEKRHVTYQGM